MAKVLQKVVMLSLAVLFGVIGLGVHTNAIPQQSSHTMGAVSQDASSTSSGCVTVCNSTKQYKTEFTDEVNEDDDDSADEPYYVQFQTSPLDGLIKDHDQRARVAISHESPPGAPAYIAFAVFRA